jgi:hypothetical protein
MRILEKLRLAKLLALAVLQYHSTSWLNRQWRSQNILSFDLKEPTQDSLGSPYLAACFTKASEHTTCELSDRKDTLESESFSLARNVILFRLGAILLELGLEAPCGDLQEPDESKQGSLAESLAATRLARSSAVLRKVGSKYAKLVNRCIFCDFRPGCDYEFDVVELQNMFYRYIVMEPDESLKLAPAL